MEDTETETETDSDSDDEESDDNDESQDDNDVFVPTHIDEEMLLVSRCCCHARRMRFSILENWIKPYLQDKNNAKMVSAETV